MNSRYILLIKVQDLFLQTFQRMLCFFFFIFFLFFFKFYYDKAKICDDTCLFLSYHLIQILEVMTFFPRNCISQIIYLNICPSFALKEK